MDVPQGKQTVTDDEIVQAMESHPDPAFTTGELAKMFDMSAEGIRGRLKSLENDGEICKKKPTARTVLWWAYSDTREPALSK